MEYLNTHPIKTSDLGFHKNLFGGKILAWVDAAASGLAMQLCDTPMVVTKGLDQCVFHKPGKEGQLMKIFGRPEKVGNSSLTLYIEARSHSVYTGKQTILLSTFITFVRIDEEGNSIPISERAKTRIYNIMSGNIDKNDRIL